MTTKRLLPLLSLLFIICSANECKKSTYNPNTDNGLPPATQTGVGTFACRANGEPAIAEGHSASMDGAIFKDSLFFFCYRRIIIAKYYSSMTFAIREKPVEGMTYQLKADLTNSVRIDTKFDCEGNLLDSYYSFYSGIGEVTLTHLDTVNHILSGTFHCTIPVPDCDTVKITDGRFDMRYFQ